MTDISPFCPRFGEAPALVCGFGSGPEHFCGEPATWHVMWNRDWENGLECDEHHAVVVSRYVYYADHPYDPVCSMIGACYDEENNCCFVPDDDFWLTSEADLPLPDAVC